MRDRKTNTKQVHESGIPESWKNAKEYAALLGYVPSSFTTAIRLLVTDDIKNDGKIQPVTKYQVSRILNTPSFKSMMYHAALELREAQVKDAKNITIGFLMNCFASLDLAALIACFVYYRKCRKLLGAEQWPPLEEMVCRESLVGAHMGTAIPRIGTGAGLLLGTARYFGMSAICMKDPQTFREYRRRLKKDGVLHDEEFEAARFGCTGTEITVFLLSGMGFGVEVGNAFARAYDKTESLKHATDDLHFRMQIGRVWIESLLAGLKQPTCPIPGHYYPLTEAFEILQSRTRVMPGPDEHFLSKTKADISKEKNPALFVKPKADSEVPAEIAHVFDYSEIEKMEEDDFDRLVDYMDDENDGKARPGTVSRKDVSELEEIVE